MRRALVVGTFLALASLPVQAASSDAAAEPTPPGAAAEALRLDFNDAAGGTPVLANLGSAAVDVSVVGQSTGTLDTVRSRPGEGHAARMPTFADDGSGPRAVVGVWSTSGDPLSPGTAPFTFGADVRLDVGTTSVPGFAASDNGDNVLQRGRFSDEAQYKLQLDHAVPSCRVKGSSGTLMVKGAEVVRGDWYTLTCQRDGSTLSLSATHYDEYGEVLSSETWSANGPTGDVQASGSAIPLSIGGKLTNDGALARDTDQLNGRVDNVVLTIG
ncbi:hypothetical protein ACPPVT_11895 [Angustibacter sp. McL0619]|uniref:hypothetical protein n=1 Tax=Angustibacter sp. McL0619 TaxID=3415676 RepID=UPI003CF9B9D9